MGIFTEGRFFDGTLAGRDQKISIPELHAY
jgi:hypothetical protein